MSYDTAQCAKDILLGLSKVDGLTTEQMLEITKSLCLALMSYPAKEHKDGLIRAISMLEDHITIKKLIG